MYTYKANIRSIYDGDSCRVDLDLGMSVWQLHNQSIRLYGIDTAEIRGGTVETKALGNLAKDYLKKRAARRLYGDAQDVYRQTREVWKGAGFDL